MERRELEVDIYQISDDALMKANRADGTGWMWGPAGGQYNGMDRPDGRIGQELATCASANQLGWWIMNPVTFTATWGGSSAGGSIDFKFEIAGDVWSTWINNQFGEGIITWNTPFLFRTKPRGSRLLICGPTNFCKPNAHPLMALIETDWITMSFTMNYKIMIPGRPVHFSQGEPLFQAIPLKTNICASLEAASVIYSRSASEPQHSRA